MDTDEIRKQIETKYNICLDIQNELGEKTYWELREYFTKEIELDNIIVNTDWAVSSNDGCGYVTDINAIKQEFNEKLKNL